MNKENDTKISIENLRTGALLWWPKDIRSMVANSSFKDAMISTYPLFEKIIIDCQTLEQVCDEVKEKHNKKELPANLFLRHCMLFTDIGWESMKKWFGKESYPELFPDKKLVVGSTILEIPQITKTSIKVDSKAIKKFFESWKQNADDESVFLNHENNKKSLEHIFACIRLLFLGSENSNDCFRKCLLSTYLEDDGTLFSADAKIKYIYVSKQTSGAEATSSGDVLEKEIAIKPIQEYLNRNYNCEFLQMDRKHEYKTGAFLVSDQWFINSQTGKAVALEVSFQETTNSVIERKRKDAKNRKENFPVNCKSAFVIDGVGSIEHRKNAVQEIIDHADIVVNASQKGVEKLAKFIGDWIFLENSN